MSESSSPPERTLRSGKKRTIPSEPLPPRKARRVEQSPPVEETQPDPKAEHTHSSRISEDIRHVQNSQSTQNPLPVHRPPPSQVIRPAQRTRTRLNTSSRHLLDLAATGRPDEFVRDEFNKFIARKGKEISIEQLQRQIKQLKKQYPTYVPDPQQWQTKAAQQKDPSKNKAQQSQAAPVPNETKARRTQPRPRSTTPASEQGHIAIEGSQGGGDKASSLKKRRRFTDVLAIENGEEDQAPQRKVRFGRTEVLTFGSSANVDHEEPRNEAPANHSAEQTAQDSDGEAQASSPSRFTSWIGSANATRTSRDDVFGNNDDDPSFPQGAVLPPIGNLSPSGNKLSDAAYGSRRMGILGIPSPDESNTAPPATHNLPQLLAAASKRRRLDDEEYIDPNSGHMHKRSRLSHTFTLGRDPAERRPEAVSSSANAASKELQTPEDWLQPEEFSTDRRRLSDFFSKNDSIPGQRKAQVAQYAEGVARQRSEGSVSSSPVSQAIDSPPVNRTKFSITRGGAAKRSPGQMSGGGARPVLEKVHGSSSLWREALDRRRFEAALMSNDPRAASQARRQLMLAAKRTQAIAARENIVRRPNSPSSPKEPEPREGQNPKNLFLGLSAAEHLEVRRAMIQDVIIDKNRKRKSKGPSAVSSGETSAIQTQNSDKPRNGSGLMQDRQEDSEILEIPQEEFQGGKTNISTSAVLAIPAGFNRSRTPLPDNNSGTSSFFAQDEDLTEGLPGIENKSASETAPNTPSGSEEGHSQEGLVYEVKTGELEGFRAKVAAKVRAEAEKALRAAGIRHLTSQAAPSTPDKVRVPQVEALKFPADPVSGEHDEMQQPAPAFDAGVDGALPVPPGSDSPNVSSTSVRDIAHSEGRVPKNDPEFGIFADEVVTEIQSIQQIIKRANSRLSRELTPEKLQKHRVQLVRGLLYKFEDTVTVLTGKDGDAAGKALRYAIDEENCAEVAGKNHKLDGGEMSQAIFNALLTNRIWLKDITKALGVPSITDTDRKRFAFLDKKSELEGKRARAEFREFQEAALHEPEVKAELTVLRDSIMAKFDEWLSLVSPQSERPCPEFDNLSACVERAVLLKCKMELSEKVYNITWDAGISNRYDHSRMESVQGNIDKLVAIAPNQFLSVRLALTPMVYVQQPHGSDNEGHEGEKMLGDQRAGDDFLAHRLLTPAIVLLFDD